MRRPRCANGELLTHGGKKGNQWCLLAWGETWRLTMPRRLRFALHLPVDAAAEEVATDEDVGADSAEV